LGRRTRELGGLLPRKNGVVGVVGRLPLELFQEVQSFAGFGYNGIDVGRQG